MKGKDQEKLEALILGSLIGTSLIADSLIRNGVIERSELVAPLSEAESLATDERRPALSVLRQLIETGYEGQPTEGANDP